MQSLGSMIFASRMDIELFIEFKDDFTQLRFNSENDVLTPPPPLQNTSTFTRLREETASPIQKYVPAPYKGVPTKP